MDAKRIDYIERLIEGVREQIVNEHKKMNIEYPDLISGIWLDADILCDVIESEVLPGLKNKLEDRL